MSVYIKGFPLPNNCGACPLRLAWCRERIYMVTRPERCPFIPVPAHGRLIDADALIIELMDRGIEGLQTDDWHEIQQAIMDAPTIIEAEEGESHGNS